MDEDTIGSFSRRNDQDNDDLSDLLNNKKVFLFLLKNTFKL